jgi:acyl dehydratase
MSFEYHKVKNWRIADATQHYSARDTILYALGIGAATRNPPEHPEFVYEKSLRALPTMAMVLAPGPLWVADPATGIDLARLLHGEQSLVIHQPLAAQGAVLSRSRVEEIYDRGKEKGAVMILLRELYDLSGSTLLATARSTVLLRGNGGFGGPPPDERLPKLPGTPDGPPELLLESVTRPELAAIYRLLGDTNPLHIDARFAAAAGFERPILHGLCSFGIAGRALLALLGDNDPARLRRLDVRFASPAYPGETLRTEVWRGSSPGSALFRVRAMERDTVVLSNGYAQLAVP